MLVIFSSKGEVISELMVGTQLFGGRTETQDQPSHSQFRYLPSFFNMPTSYHLLNTYYFALCTRHYSLHFIERSSNSYKNPAKWELKVLKVSFTFQNLFTAFSNCPVRIRGLEYQTWHIHYLCHLCYLSKAGIISILQIWKPYTLLHTPHTSGM